MSDSTAEVPTVSWDSPASSGPVDDILRLQKLWKPMIGISEPSEIERLFVECGEWQQMYFCGLIDHAKYREMVGPINERIKELVQ